MKGIGTAVSEDFPNLMTGKFTIKLKKPDVKPTKRFYPRLKFGVSSETPQQFHLSNVPILTREMKNKTVSPTDPGSMRFINSLKKYEISKKEGFTYQDFCFYGKCVGTDTDSVSFTKSIDFNSQELPKRSSAYYKAWKERYDTPESFKKHHGVFTWNTNHEFQHRVQYNDYKNLKTRAESRKSSRSTSPEISKRPQSSAYSARPIKHIHQHTSQKSFDSAIGDLDKFEASLDKIHIKNRKMYEINNQVN